jgi:hypothetical protein
MPAKLITIFFAAFSTLAASAAGAASIEWANGSIPANAQSALEVGTEANGTAIFLCAAVVGNRVYAGKTWAGQNFCDYSDGQRERTAVAFAIATVQQPISWASRSSAVPDRMVRVGGAPGREYYLCRVRHAGGVHPGWTDRPDRGCTIGFGGASYVVDADVEVALGAAGIGRGGEIPLLVRLLSPLPSSERFKDVCAPSVTYVIADPSAAALIAGDVPNVGRVIHTLARNICAILYREPAEVPLRALTLEVAIDNQQRAASAWAATSGVNESKVTIKSGYLHEYASRQKDQLALEFVGILYHEITHTLQQNNFDETHRLALTEGVADYVRWARMTGLHGDVGGKWTDGYRTTGFFLDWLERSRPGFVYELNKSAAPHANQRWTIEVFRELTGRSVDELWRAYQDSLAGAPPDGPSPHR